MSTTSQKHMSDFLDIVDQTGVGVSSMDRGNW